MGGKCVVWVDGLGVWGRKKWMRVGQAREEGMLSFARIFQGPPRQTSNSEGEGAWSCHMKVQNWHLVS